MKLAPRVVSTPDLPTTAQLLVSGGDARIALDPHSGLNQYGCRPFPDPALLALGSSTASVVSNAGYAAADRLRERMLQEAGADTLATIHVREMQRIRRELLHAGEVSDLGVELVFATSGTHVHAIAARYVARYVESAEHRPLRVVMVEEGETGSGVPAALRGAHSAASPPGLEASIEVSAVPLRLADGMPRPSNDVDTDVTALVNEAVRLGVRVLLVMVDQSKTGLVAPSAACVAALHHRHPGHVDVLVDACQFRIAAPTLRVYLQRGFMVALTGSKFFTGPSFSAALLFPASVAQRLKVRTDEDSGAANFGLLLRWEAALAELRRFRAVPQPVVIRFLQSFALAVQQRLMNDPRFEPLGVPTPDRHPLLESQGWDHLQSIFPFLLFRSTAAGRIPLSREETLRIYRQLPEDSSTDAGNGTGSLRCQLGQPVACGARDGIPVSALRLCVSARMISDANGKKGIDGVVDEALAALNKTAWLAGRLSD